LFQKLKPKSEFSRNILTLMTGTTIAQAIPIAISPILTRLYTPEDFGVFALYMSISGIVAVIATGRYELAIILPTSEDEAKHIFVLSLLITLVISLITLFGILFFNELITNLLDNQKISSWLYFIPLTVFTLGIYQSLSYWLNRQKSYKDIAANKAIQSATIASANLSLGFSKFMSFGLIGGQIIGQGVAMILLYKKVIEKDPNIFSKITFSKITILARRYIDFLTINTLHSFINMAKENFANILIATQYVSAYLGMYYLVIKVMKAPVTLIGYSVSQVFYKKATDLFNENKNIYKLVRKMMISLFLVGILPLIAFLTFAIDVFSLIFGEDWSIAGYYAQALAPYIFLHFIASPLGMVPIIVKKQKQALLWGITESALFIFSFIMGYTLFEDLNLTLWLLSLTMFLYFPVYFLWILKISKGKKRK